MDLKPWMFFAVLHLIVLCLSIGISPCCHGNALLSFTDCLLRARSETSHQLAAVNQPQPLLFTSGISEVQHLSCLMALQNHLGSQGAALLNLTVIHNHHRCKLPKQRLLLILLLLISGNVHPNPGPEQIMSYDTPESFKCRKGLGFCHLNVRSLVGKIDMVRIWALSTNADVFVLSETWLNKSISDMDVTIGGYNLFRRDRPKKGGGVVIYVKKSFIVNVIVSKSISRQF